MRRTFDISSGEVPPVRFADSHGARIAYQDFGIDGPVVVSIPPLAQNIELAWDRREVRSMFEHFAAFCRFIHFDKRGTGASDRSMRVNTIDERVDDVRAVMDHAGVDRAHLFATSEGGAMAILFAATYPDRVESLTLNGSAATMVPQDLDGDALDAVRQTHAVFAQLWGTEHSVVADRFAPSLAVDPEFRAWHQRYERSAASQDSLADLLEMLITADVSELLPSLQVPTLVVHRTGDRVVPVDLGRALAASIAGARLVELPGDDHFNYAGDMVAWMDEFERFITGSNASERPALVGTPTVRIHVLGGFGVTIGDREVPISEWGSRRARQLCKRLVLARGWPVTRDELFEVLWPGEYDRRRLGARLSVQLSAVRRVLGGGVVADRDTVRLDLDEVDTDLEDLYAAEDDAAIVAAYPGDLLPEDVYEDWTSGARAEARDRFVGAARRIATSALDDGSPAEAGTLARRLVATDLYDLDGHRLLVTSLLRSDESAAARRAHGAWSEVAADLGVPVPALDDLS